MSATTGEALPDLLTTDEVAEYLRISVPTLERMRLHAESGLPYIKLGIGKNGRVVYHRDDITAFIDRQRRTSTSDNGDEE